MRENNIKDKKSDNAIIKSNKISIIGFIVAIILLTTAVSLAINQEKAERETKLAERMNSNTSISTSKKMGKNINEVRNELELEAKKENTISDSNLVDSKNTSTVSNANNINENNTNTVNGNNTNNANVNNTNKNKIISTNAPGTSTKNSTNSSSKNKENKSNNTNENKKTNSTENKVEFIRPIEGETSKIFSTDSLIYSETLQEWVTHRGIDIKAEKGAEVKAIANGTIKSIKTDPRYGISVIIKHNNGFESVYACLLNVAQGLKEGDTVEQGQVIGNIGNSGIFESAEGMHLHFEMTKDGDYVNPDIYVK